MNILLILICFVCSNLSAESWQKRRKAYLKQKEEAFLQEEQRLQEFMTPETAALAQNECKEIFDVPANYVLLERPAIIIHGPERQHVICESELYRQTIYGVQPKIQDLIDDELVFQEGIRYKVPVDSTIADKYILALCQQNNLTTNDVNLIFRNSGLTLEQGKQELVKMYTKNTVIEHKILSRIFIPQQEIEAYYNAHPIMKPTKYEVQVAVIPYNGQDRSLQKKEIITRLKSEGIKADWSESFWLTESELADDKKFITRMKPGQVYPPQETVRGFELMMLVSRKEAHAVPLEKRYREIVTHLREQKAQKMIEDYVEELRKNASVAFCF